jgi:hypothetical protein
MQARGDSRARKSANLPGFLPETGSYPGWFVVALG